MVHWPPGKFLTLDRQGVTVRCSRSLKCIILKIHRMVAKKEPPPLRPQTGRAHAPADSAAPAVNAPPTHSYRLRSRVRPSGYPIFSNVVSVASNSFSLFCYFSSGLYTNRIASLKAVSKGLKSESRVFSKRVRGRGRGVCDCEQKINLKLY